ncbi:MAG: VOC family protein [Chitinophagaceae bacterium]
MDTTTNSLNWFEIPVSDMARAKHFYQVIFSIHMHEMEMMGMKMAGFPGEPGSGKVSGALVQSENHVPSADGAVLYLNANPDMSPVLERIAQEGGHIVLPKTVITSEIGYMAFFIDTEGNKVGLHSQG